MAEYWCLMGRLLCGGFWWFGPIRGLVKGDCAVMCGLDGGFRSRWRRMRTIEAMSFRCGCCVVKAEIWFFGGVVEMDACLVCRGFGRYVRWGFCVFSSGSLYLCPKFFSSIPPFFSPTTNLSVLCVFSYCLFVEGLMQEGRAGK